MLNRTDTEENYKVSITKRWEGRKAIQLTTLWEILQSTQLSFALTVSWDILEKAFHLMQVLSQGTRTKHQKAAEQFLEKKGRKEASHCDSKYQRNSSFLALHLLISGEHYTSCSTVT